MEITMLGKKHNLRFQRYSNKNINITAKPDKGPAIPITSNTIIKLAGEVAIRDSKNVIDELIHARVIKEKYSKQINESGNKMLVYELTDFCKQHQGE